MTCDPIFSVRLLLIDLRLRVEFFHPCLRLSGVLIVFVFATLIPVFRGLRLGSIESLPVSVTQFLVSPGVPSAWNSQSSLYIVFLLVCFR